MLTAIAIVLAIGLRQEAFTPQAILADIVRLQVEYRQCLTDQTLALGTSNSESADTVLRGVSWVCLPKETELREAYAKSPFPAAQVQGLMERDRRLGENAGVASLLAARAKRGSPG